jgi:hypothetical protein
MTYRDVDGGMRKWTWRTIAGIVVFAAVAFGYGLGCIEAIVLVAEWVLIHHPRVHGVVVVTSFILFMVSVWPVLFWLGRQFNKRGF